MKKIKAILILYLRLGQVISLTQYSIQIFKVMSLRYSQGGQLRGINLSDLIIQLIPHTSDLLVVTHILILYKLNNIKTHQFQKKLRIPEIELLHLFIIPRKPQTQLILKPYTSKRK